MRGLGAGLLALFVSSCGGLDIEHKIRVGTDCPDPEVVARHLVYRLHGGGTLVCNHIRVVSGPPHRDATWLECQPAFVEPPSERRSERR